jgi:predicted nucleotidyltransferase
MVLEVREKVSALIDLCAQRGVRSLSVFGSAVTGGFDPERSDVDLLVEFQPMTAAEHAEAYLSLIEDAEALLGRSVDLLEPQAIRNPYVRQRVEAEREVLYAAP